MSWLLTLIESLKDSIFTAVVFALAIAFAKTIVRIFKMGVTFKAELATKQEQKEFEDEIRKDMRGYANQIQQTVLNACMRTIDNRLSDLDSIKDTAADMKAMKASMETEIRVTMEKYDEIKSIGDTVRVLNNKVQRLEYGEQTSSERRTEK